MLLRSPIQHPDQRFIMDVSNLNGVNNNLESSMKGNNPMLTLSGHDIQALNILPGSANNANAALNALADS